MSFDFPKRAKDESLAHFLGRWTSTTEWHFRDVAARLEKLESQGNIITAELDGVGDELSDLWDLVCPLGFGGASCAEPAHKEEQKAKNYDWQTWLDEFGNIKWHTNWPIDPPISSAKNAEWQKWFADNAEWAKYIDWAKLANEAKACSGAKVIHTFPDGEAVVSMCKAFGDRIIIATNLNLYELKGDKLVKVTLETAT